MLGDLDAARGLSALERRGREVKYISHRERRGTEIIIMDF